MATKDDTVALWLHNKLGSTSHLWSFSSTVVSQYTIEKLQSIKDCFITLDSLVKFKFFLSLFNIPKRNIDEFKSIIQEIIDNTIQTCLDQWVLSIAMFVQAYWLSQTLDTQKEYDLESFKEALNDLKRKLRECIHTKSGSDRTRFLLPIEIDYLNKEARFNLLPNTSIFSNEFLSSLSSEENSMFKKHFNLIKLPKAMHQLNDLKNKAAHYSKSKTTKSLVHSGLNSFNDYNSDNNMSSSSITNVSSIGFGSSSTNKTVPYMNRFMTSKKMESMTNLANPSLINNNNMTGSSDPYSSKIFSNSSNSISLGSSSFFKRSSFNTNSSSTTITGKSSAPRRNVGIKLLDVQEQSASPKEAKRKRKEQEKETLKKQKLVELQKQNQEREEQISAQQLQHENSFKLAASTTSAPLTQDENEFKESEQHVEQEKQQNEADVAVSYLVGMPTQEQQSDYNNINNKESVYSAIPESCQIKTDDFRLTSFKTNEMSNLNNSDMLGNAMFSNYPNRQNTQINNMLLNMNNNNNSYYFSKNNNANEVSNASDVYKQQQDYKPMLQIGDNLNMKNYSLPSVSSTLSGVSSTFNRDQLGMQVNFGSSSPVKFPQNNEFSNNKLEQFTIAGSSINNSTSIQQQLVQQQQYTQQQQHNFSMPSTTPLLSSSINQPHQHQQQQQQQQNQQNQQQHQQQQQQPNQSLSLTREQMLQAQEMFSNSNKLTRHEKALILGFIAGARQNPHPENGPLVTIKLSELEELFTAPNGQQHKVLSELFFQMNYETGEYKKIKKLKPMITNK